MEDVVRMSGRAVGKPPDATHSARREIRRENVLRARALRASKASVSRSFEAPAQLLSEEG